MQTWMVRCGRFGRSFDDFRERSMVAIGWRAVGDLSVYQTRAAMTDAVRHAYPTFKEQAVAQSAGQLYRFAREFSIGDRVVTYDPRARQYLCGEITGSYRYVPSEEQEGHSNQRTVKWAQEISRDSLSDAAQNTLGSTLTIFNIPLAVSSELWRDSNHDSEDPVASVSEKAPVAIGPVPSQYSDEDVVLLASEAIKDRVADLSWDDMQELVAGLLRAMGYKTLVSPPGSDRGKDIVASPDGFVFQEPRIVVEVKHRRNSRMGAQEIRSFIGGRHANDKGLYVSTGGFSREAYYEAERATIPVTLMDFELLTEAILEYYARFDEETKQILPLRRIYWPVTS